MFQTTNQLSSNRVKQKLLIWDFCKKLGQAGRYFMIFLFLLAIVWWSNEP